MTVEKLISLLSKYKPESEVAIKISDEDIDIPSVLAIKNTGMGSPYDEDGFSVIDNSEIPDEYFNNQCEYVGPKIVLIKLKKIYK